MSWLRPRAFVKMASNEPQKMTKYCLLLILVLLPTYLAAEDNSGDKSVLLTDNSPQLPSYSREDISSDTEEKTTKGTGIVENLGDTAHQAYPQDGLESEEENVAGIASDNSFFSLEGLIRSVIQPVIEEFKNGNMEKESERSNEMHTDMVKMPKLEIEAPLIENFTTAETADPSVNQQNGTQNEEEKTAKKLKFQCYGKNVTENDTAIVKIVNSTELLQRLSFKTNESSCDCVLVMFYAPWCPFSAETAPHYNALGRAYPNLEVLAVDAIHFSNLNARFGTVSVPNILLFHQSRAVVKFNQSTRSFDNFVQFVRNLTGLEPNMSVTLEDQDYQGPLSNIPTKEVDYLLWLAWMFVIVCSTYMLTVSSTGQHIINRVNILWQEHQHIE